ncbi:regulatory protein RecX [Pseudohongiella spirulinae]|uniref:Regulatory protein RecX n=1 Tax=Pseudohongiella spirulinae TaxID=1249552 RepID=A0A0S2KCL3_9GAMM|nr:RecX family transcriptional regulator [Pseudohongiella spirulinae]
MDYLARREHSRLQLQRKLRNKFPDSQESEIDQVLNELESDKLLSDERFAESYCYSKSARGYGPLYIRHQLSRSGLSSGIIDRLLQSFDEDFWVERLAEFLARKRIYEWPEFGSPEWQRTNRLVLSRGFSAEHIKAISALPGLD